MNILYVLPKQDFFLHGRRGRVAHALGVVEGLTANGIDVTVVSGEGVAKSFADVSVARSLEVPGINRGIFRNWRWTTRIIAKVGKELGDGAIDAVIVRYAVSNAFRFHKLFTRSSDSLCCFEVNSLAYHQYHRLPIYGRKLLRFFELRILASANLIYAVSTGLALDLQFRNRNAPEVAVIPNAASSLELTPRPGVSTPSTDAGNVTFVYMGVFQAYYDLELVVQSFRIARARGLASQMHLYGDGSQYNVIHGMVQSSEPVHLHGRYDLNALLSSGVLDSNTILMLPNRGEGMSEIGSPIKLYEYMSIGLPILASAVAQATEVLQDGETGIFYEPGNAASCAEAMLRLSADADLRRRLATNVRENFLANHTWKARMSVLAANIEKARNNCRR